MLKKGKIVVALLCLGSIASAQSVVTLGTFGFTKDTAAIDAGFNISGMQFYNAASNSPTTLYSTNLPVGSVIHVWNGVTYESSTYKSSGYPPVLGWTSEPELEHGQAYWVEVPMAATNTLSGDVPMESSMTNSIVVGFQLCSFPYPVDRVVSSLDFNPSVGDVIHVWNGVTYESSTYKSSGYPPVLGWTLDLSISAGQGFWYEAVGGSQWIANRPYPAN